ncbi:hypothetical protein MCOR02_000683 [Pyricularia oryzae]|nr:hypothetical protein MCOR02_000683 [Pyricularia oryzae]
MSFGRQAVVRTAMVETNTGSGDAVQASATNSAAPEHAPTSHSEKAGQDYPQPNLNPELFVVASRDPAVEAAGKKAGAGSGKDDETPTGAMTQTRRMKRRRRTLKADCALGSLSLDLGWRSCHHWVL